MTIVEQKLKNSLWPIDATKLLLIVIVFISLLSIAGCKKCMLCSDTCYQCSSGLSVCSADVSTPQIFDSLIAFAIWVLNDGNDASFSDMVKAFVGVFIKFCSNGIKSLHFPFDAFTGISETSTVFSLAISNFGLSAFSDIFYHQRSNA